MQHIVTWTSAPSRLKDVNLACRIALLTLRDGRLRWYPAAMFREVARCLLGALKDIFRSRAGLVAENAVLRQQVILLQRGKPHPRLKVRDRFTIAAVTRLFSATMDAVTVVRPETVLGWHRSLWRTIWSRRSRHCVGRPIIDVDTRSLIRRIWTENPLWGEDQIAAQLARLGHHVSPSRPRPARSSRPRPSSRPSATATMKRPVS
jgi:hypothetical protein